MRIPHSIATRRAFDISMTPMIDVVFLLLIFFVCTASFQAPESILPSLLSSAGAINQQPPPIENVTLDHIIIELLQKESHSQILVNGQPFASIRQLSETLLQLSTIDQTLPVILDISDETLLGFVIDIYDQCRLAGFEQIQFAADSSL